MKSSTRVRNMPSLPKIAAHWRNAAADVFPDIRANWTGWGEPFCFRCGWLSPEPADMKRDPWSYASGWLERAHMQDHCTGGAEDSSNIVPLCPLCHSAMPESLDDQLKALAWVRSGQPVTCQYWWQLHTDDQWGGERYCRYPGWRIFLRARMTLDDEYRQLLAEAG